MDIFVTGATGVLGRPVVRALVAAGHRVRALSRSAENRSLISELGAEPVEGDLYDAASMREAMAGCSAVLHLATKIPPTAQVGRPQAWLENDRIRTEGTRILVDAAIAAGVSVFVYPSVCLVYPSSGEKWIDAETTPPDAPAIHSTVDAEAEVARFATDGRRGIVLRMGSFYGPGAASTRDQIRMAHLGIAPVPGPTDGYVSTIWIADAARAVVASLAGGVPSGTYDVVDDEPFPRGELIGVIARSLGRKRLLRLPEPVIRVTTGAVGEYLSRSQRVSNRRFKAASGWAPEVRDSRVGWARLAESERERAGDGPPHDRRLVKAGLAFLALGGLVIGLWALLAPLTFYQSFPGFGHRWVVVDGPYNEHLIRDVGGGTLALAVLAIVALLRPTAQLVGATGLAILVSSVPHFIYHLLHLALLPTTLDRVVQTALLGVIPAVAALLLWRAARWDVAPWQNGPGGIATAPHANKSDATIAPGRAGKRYT
ncbi:MAG TPA: NAD-dependent epimerase/dehydratase family protein [Ktedonobacterales bacterium]